MGFVVLNAELIGKFTQAFAEAVPGFGSSSGAGSGPTASAIMANFTT
jgi:hypothetical protein